MSNTSVFKKQTEWWFVIESSKPGSIWHIHGRRSLSREESMCNGKGEVLGWPTVVI